MSSRFVSGGTIRSSGDGNAVGETPETETTQQQSSKSAEWDIVEKELAAERQRREEQRRKAATGEEKSLYDILQENKAAKQAAFEEQNRIKNQFRALDDDEVDFLDEVRQKKRQEEELVKKETEQGLRAFREAQKDRGEPGAEEDGGGLEEKQNDGQEESWGVGRKRKRAREKEVKGVRRKASEGEGHREDGNDDAKPVESKTQSTKGDDKVKSDKPAQAAAAPQAKQPALGLVDYGSDSDD